MEAELSLKQLKSLKRKVERELKRLTEKNKLHLIVSEDERKRRIEAVKKFHIGQKIYYPHVVTNDDGLLREELYDTICDLDKSGTVLLESRKKEQQYFDASYILHLQSIYNKS